MLVNQATTLFQRPVKKLAMLFHTPTKNWPTAAHAAFQLATSQMTPAIKSPIGTSGSTRAAARTPRMVMNAASTTSTTPAMIGAKGISCSISWPMNLTTGSSLAAQSANVGAMATTNTHTLPRMSPREPSRGAIFWNASWAFWNICLSAAWPAGEASCCAQWVNMSSSGLKDAPSGVGALDDRPDHRADLLQDLPQLTKPLHGRADHLLQRPVAGRS